MSETRYAFGRRGNGEAIHAITRPGNARLCNVGNRPIVIDVSLTQADVTCRTCLKGIAAISCEEISRALSQED